MFDFICMGSTELLGMERERQNLSKANANEIKHGHPPVVIVVLDPRYD